MGSRQHFSSRATRSEVLGCVHLAPPGGLQHPWDLPFGREHRFLAGAPGIIDHILGGWPLFWIAYMETGQFFTPSFSGADPSNTNTSRGLSDRIANGNLSWGQRSIRRWFDASAFVRPPAARFGNSGVNVLEGPGLYEHNLTVSTRFRIKERLSVTYMAAMQNVFNHSNFNNSSANISAPASVGESARSRGLPRLVRSCCAGAWISD